MKKLLLSIHGLLYMAFLLCYVNVNNYYAYLTFHVVLLFIHYFSLIHKKESLRQYVIIQTSFTLIVLVTAYVFILNHVVLLRAFDIFGMLFLSIALVLSSYAIYKYKCYMFDRVYKKH